MPRSRNVRGPIVLLIMIVAAALAGLPAAPAAANVCVTCDDEQVPLPGTPTARYQVTQPDYLYYNLLGLKPEDSSGYDEAYFKINGAKVWGVQTVAAGPFPSPGNGRHPVHFTYTFYTGFTQSPSFYISMFDEDSPDPDDKLGGHQVTGPVLAVGKSMPIWLTFDEDSADYRLELQLKRIA